MPKKRTFQYAKPASAPHPSLASHSRQDTSRHSNSGSDATAASVNDLIRHLRRTQTTATESPPSHPQEDLNAHTVHPSLKAILDVPDTPAPRPRPGMPNARWRRVRGPAGPPPPKSWLEKRSGGAAHLPKTSGPDHRLTDKHVGSMPGAYFPQERSLEHLVLKSLAKNWQWHTRYDQFHLATLPVRHKETLLTYISAYNNRGIDVSGLDLLFLDESELDGATGSENITHLDLGTSVGRAISMEELKGVLMKRTFEIMKPWEAEDIPESWDDDAHLATSLCISRFPALTHLSLSNPANVSWKGLLNLSQHLATITHLSLAFWPTPSMTPNSKTAYRESPAGNIDYGASNFYSNTDGDYSEAAGVLKRLSKATYCLQWLDLTGCSEWVQVLGRQDGPDWAGAWRGLETVKVGQGWIPTCLESPSSGWRDLYGDSPDPWMADSLPTTAPRKELVMWAAVEDRISSSESIANTIIRSARLSQKSGRYGSLRSEKVTFNRGWEGWWIEDAINHIALTRNYVSRKWSVLSNMDEPLILL